MSDIRTVWRVFDGDWRVLGPRLEEDDGLETAVIHSLFTDARALPNDELPDPKGDRRGWWGDNFPSVPGDRYGSRLWLLSREKQLDAVLPRAKAYAQEALQWLIADGIARSVTVVAEIVRDGVLGLAIEIRRANEPVAQYRFDLFWKGGLNAV